MLSGNAQRHRLWRAPLILRILNGRIRIGRVRLFPSNLVEYLLSRGDVFGHVRQADIIRLEKSEAEMTLGYIGQLWGYGVTLQAVDNETGEILHEMNFTPEDLADT